MQKFRACRKRFSLIQRRRSTSSACMIAICPAGPPKLMKPSLSQKRNASEKEIGSGRAEGAREEVSGKAVSTEGSVLSHQRLDGTPSFFAEREAVFPGKQS
ncbi:hypothetical protein ABIC38_000446 [Variovorax sp. 1126]